MGAYQGRLASDVAPPHLPSYLPPGTMGEAASDGTNGQGPCSKEGMSATWSVAGSESGGGGDWHYFSLWVRLSTRTCSSRHLLALVFVLGQTCRATHQVVGGRSCGVDTAPS